MYVCHNAVIGQRLHEMLQEDEKKKMLIISIHKKNQIWANA